MALSSTASAFVELPSDAALQRELFGDTAHPATNHLHLTNALISSYSREGDLVFDPMAGTGATGILAARAGRDAECFDIEEHFVVLGNQAWKRLSAQTSILPYGNFNFTVGDATRPYGLRRKANLLVTSPPFIDSIPSDNRDGEYWDRFFAEKEKRDGRTYRGTKAAYSRTYGTHKRNLGRKMPYAEYGNQMLAVYRGMRAVAAPGATAAVIVRDVMREGERVPLARDTKLWMEMTGWRVIDRLERKVQLGLWTRTRKNRGHEVVETETVWLAR